MTCTTPPTVSRHPEPRRLRLLHSAFCILPYPYPPPPDMRRPRRRSWYFPANHAKNANENAFRNSRSFACLAGNPQSAFPRGGRAQHLTVRNLITPSRSTLLRSATIPQNALFLLHSTFCLLPSSFFLPARPRWLRAAPPPGQISHSEKFDNPHAQKEL